MSTAVYLAASVYLHRLAVTERIISITRLNVHRLLLAALRVASKGLEDLSHPHKRFAKVGGLTELELSRLEVSEFNQPPLFFPRDFILLLPLSWFVWKIACINVDLQFLQVSASS